MQMLPNCDPVYKVSISSRGTALGYTMHLPADDRYLKGRTKFMDDLAGVLGGRAAEVIVFSDTITGASYDFESATDLARAMVMRHGMSGVLGQRTFGAHEQLVFLGREISEQRDHGEQVARQIDEEIKRIIDAAHAKAKAILSTYRDAREAIANRLIVAETIDAAELATLVGTPIDNPVPLPVPA